MKGTHSMKLVNRILKVIFSVALLVGLAAAPVPAQTTVKQKVVVHLTHYTDNLHAVKMAVHLSAMMQSMGAEVTLLLDLEGVRLADTRQPGDLIWGKGEPISKELAAFVKAGGQLLLCPHCAEHAGITAATLRPGARIGATGELPRVILAADKILDY
jgi:predicted peroxiredoxin